MGMRSALALFLFLLASFAAAGIGGLFTGPGVREWYPTLAKPTWTPPAWLFGPVWTVLYILIAIAGFLAWRKAGFGGAKAAGGASGSAQSSAMRARACGSVAGVT